MSGTFSFVKVIDWLFYFGLVAVSILFIHQTMKDFSDGKTYFLESKSPLTSEDMICKPTLTICFDQNAVQNDESVSKWTYGSHFKFQWWYYDSDETKIYLDEGSNELMYDGIKHQYVLTPLILVPIDQWVYRHCLKISPTETELISGEINHTAYFLLEFISPAMAPKVANLYVTSEKNAYGAVFQQWLDGEVEPYPLRNGSWTRNLHLRSEEIHHHYDKCQAEQSYYQCLASKLMSNQNCPTNLCTPYTLPSNTTFEDLEVCKTWHEAFCQGEVLLALHKDETICKADTEKLCEVQEYKITGDSGLTDQSEWLNGYWFNIRIEPPVSSRSRGGNSPNKKLFKEYYVLDLLQLIGTIGGTLGLMIGFSFIGWISWISNYLTKLASKLKSRS